MSDKPQQDQVSVSRELEIWIDPDRQEGLPCIKGTRVPVHLVLRAIEQTGSIAGALRSYPQLTEQQVKDALYFAQQRLLDSSEQIIRELRADKDRLDWLESQKGGVAHEDPRSEFEMLNPWEAYSGLMLGKADRIWKPTVREAIDAARSRPEPGEAFRGSDGVSTKGESND